MAPSALRNTAWSSAAVYIEYLLGLVASVLVARALQPADMGVYGLLTWVVATGMALANAGITLAAIKFVAELRGAGREGQVATLVARLRRLQRWTLLVVMAVVGVAFGLARERLAPGVAWPVLALILLSLGLRAPYMLNTALLKGSQDFRSVALVAVAGSVLNLAMVAAAWTQAASLPVFVAVYAVSSFVFWGVSHWRAARWAGAGTAGEPLPAELDARLRHHLRVVAVTSVVGAIGGGEIELLPLNLLADAHDAGLFKVASALAVGATLLVPGVLSAQLLPLMAHARGRGTGLAEARFVAMTAWLVALGAPLVAFGIVHAWPLIALLYGGAYAAAAPAFAVLIAARTAGMVGQGATAYLLSADRQAGLLRLTLVFTTLRIAAAFAATWAFGLRGALVAALVLGLAGSAVTIRFALRASHTRLPWPRLLRIGVAAALPALACVPLVQALPALPALVAGGAVFALAYPLALWRLRGLGTEDEALLRAWIARRRGRTA